MSHESSLTQSGHSVRQALTAYTLKIKNEYVRAPQIGLIFCDAQCFAEHEKMSASALKSNVRKVS